MIFLYNSSVKIQIPIRPSPAPGDHDLNNFESTIPKNAHRQSSTLVLTLHKNIFTSVFSVKLLFEKMIFESYQ